MNNCGDTHLELCPLFAEINPDIGPRHGEVGAARVETEVADLVALIQLQRLEVLQLAQIPKLDTAVVRSRGQVVTCSAVNASVLLFFNSFY